MGGVGILPIRARQQQTGGPVDKLKTRTVEGQGEEEYGRLALGFR